jgi:hypothetical protein
MSGIWLGSPLRIGPPGFVGTAFLLIDREVLGLSTSRSGSALLGEQCT